MGKVDTPYDDLTHKIIGLAMEVHNELGPGFNEETYHHAMMIMLNEAQIPFVHEFVIEIMFRGQKVGECKLDFVIRRQIILEFKALASLESVHERLLISYLAASGLDVDLLLNFGAARLEYKRIFPTKAIQASAAFQERKNKFK